MATTTSKLLIVSRDLLLQVSAVPGGGSVLRKLANLTRRGCHLLLTAPEPDQWFPTRGSDDDALASQGRLREQIQEFGGDLDGTYYVPTSRISQNPNRLGALRDILVRYHFEPQQATLFSADRPFLTAAETLGIEVVAITDDAVATLEKRLDDLA